MEIAGGIEDESRGCKKQKGPQNTPEDRLTDLPDSILVHILSFLPTRDAVRTVALKRFGNLWTEVHSFDFDRCLYHDCLEYRDYVDGSVYEKKLTKLIRHVMILHQASEIHGLRLRFLFRGLSNAEETEAPSIGNEIDTWIRFALRKNVKVLELDLSACEYVNKDNFHRLHNAVLRSDSLTELNLFSCLLEPKGQQVHMRFLKTLHLRWVFLSDSTMVEILSGCPMLKTLSLIECYGLHELKFTSKNLKHVKIRIILDQFDRSDIIISGQYLTSLEITGGIRQAKLFNLKSLNDATLGYGEAIGFPQEEYREFRMLLEKLNHTKAFTMRDRCILVVAIWELKYLRCPSSERKHLVLDTKLTKWHLPGLAGLLRSSPNLEILDIHIRPGTDPFGLDKQRLEQYDIDEHNFWDSQRETFHCVSSHIKIIRLDGFVIKPLVVKLVQFLLKNAAALEKMFICTKEYVKPGRGVHQGKSIKLSDGHGFTEQVLSFSRASDRSVILFS